jgi:hypothetical protein
VNSSPQLQMARLALASLSPGERVALLAEIATTKTDRVLSRSDVAERFNRTPLVFPRFSGHPGVVL